jgi:hypothetical protein
MQLTKKCVRGVFVRQLYEAELEKHVERFVGVLDNEEHHGTHITFQKSILGGKESSFKRKSVSNASPIKRIKYPYPSPEMHHNSSIYRSSTSLHRRERCMTRKHAQR